MAKPIKLTKRDVDHIVRLRKRGLTREEIIAQTQLGRHVVSVVLTGSGLSKTTADHRQKYAKLLDTWLAR